MYCVQLLALCIFGFMPRVFMIALFGFTATNCATVVADTATKSFKYLTRSVAAKFAFSEAPDFRILAPPFVCPKDKDAVINKPDNTIITLQSEVAVDIDFTWTVRWEPLEAPSQRFTLALWRTVRELERQLNGPQAEPGVYVINDTTLLSGVNYIFNVSASSNEVGEVMEKSFNIDNIKGDQKLQIEGRSDMFSIVLVGGQLAFADIEYTLEALVTTCYKTHDYFFEWCVSSGDYTVDVSEVKGSRLEIKANSLTPGLSYNVLCKVFKLSNGEFITENGLPFHVPHRDPDVNFSIDVLVVSVGTPFSIQTDIRTMDYLQNEVTVTWECSLNNNIFEDFQSDVDGSLVFPSGLPDVGEYVVTITVDVLEEPITSVSIARIITVETQLPVIEVYTIPRLINEGSIVNLQADVRDVTPGCSITWFFADDECLSLTNATDPHGVPISDPINVYSLEENFLSELTDYSNESGSKSVPGQVNAATGTARIVVECQCSLMNNCSTEGTVYAEVKLMLNEKPGAGDVMVMPETGIAMETIFRLSTRVLTDLHRPLQYKFYCDLGNNDSLVLGSYLEHLAIETLLPYIDGGTTLWLEVCDSLGACSVGKPTRVELLPGEARTLDALIEDVQALVLRCEIGWLLRLTASTIVTYVNAGQTEAYTKFTSTLLETLRNIDKRCTELQNDKYTAFLYWLAKLGLDVNDFV